VRELFGKSGNECAYPGCQKRILNTEGKFIAQICHIEDAKPGCRFNKSMNNERRRHVSNLLLMCYEHHVETNDEKRYAVKDMQKFKADHEAKYTTGFDKMYEEIVDQSTRIEVKEAIPLKLSRTCRQHSRAVGFRE